MDIVGEKLWKVKRNKIIFFSCASDLENVLFDSSNIKSKSFQDQGDTKQLYQSIHFILFPNFNPKLDP